MTAQVGKSQLEALAEGAVSNLEQEISEKDKTIALLMKQVQALQTENTNLKNKEVLLLKESTDASARADALHRSLVEERAQAEKDRAEIAKLRNDNTLLSSKAALVDRLSTCLEEKKKIKVPPLTQAQRDCIHSDDRPVYEKANLEKFQSQLHRGIPYGLHYSDIVDILLTQQKAEGKP